MAIIRNIRARAISGIAGFELIVTGEANTGMLAVVPELEDKIPPNFNPTILALNLLHASDATPEQFQQIRQYNKKLEHLDQYKTVEIYHGEQRIETIPVTEDRPSETSKAALSATKEGWWIKVNLSKQEASQITFQIGTDEDNKRFWRNWNTGEPNEFDVPSEYKNVAELYIHATSNPTGKNSWFCMMYRERGVKHFDFDDDEDHKEAQDDSDGECR